MKKIPFGWSLDAEGNEVPNDYEQELISIVRGYKSIGLSFAEIAEKLTDVKFKTRNGYLVFSEIGIQNIYNSKLVVYN